MKLFGQTKPENIMPFTAPPTTFNFLPDQTLPPRLLSVDMPFGHRTTAFWLRDQQTNVVTPEIFAVRRDGETYRLILLENPRNIPVLLNGEVVHSPVLIKDGDFIQVGQTGRMILEVDPVKDYREGMADETGDYSFPDTEVNLTKNMERFAVINKEGVSFNGGYDFARWEDIAYFTIYKDPQTGTCSIHVTVIEADLTVKQLPTKFNQNCQEAAELLKWVMLAAPYAITLWDFTGRFWGLVDAYYFAAVNKIFIPFENGKRELPATREFILAIPTRKERLVHDLYFAGIFMGFVIGGGFILAVIGELNGVNNNFFWRWFEISKAFFGYGSVIVLIALSVPLLQRLDQWLKARGR